MQPECNYYEALFAGWAAERKQQLERSLAATIVNGDFCCEPSRVKQLLRNWYLWAVQLVPSRKHRLQLGGRVDGMAKYDWSIGMPFLPQYEGGKSFPQVFSAPIDGPAPAIPTFTDDTIFGPEKKGIFQIVALLDSVDQLHNVRGDLAHIKTSDSLSFLDPTEATLILHGEIPAVPQTSPLLGPESARGNTIRVLSAEEYTAAGVTESALKIGFPRPPPLFYDPSRIRKDLGFDKVYVIVRWDRFVFAACRDRSELQKAAGLIEGCLKGQKVVAP